MDHVKTYSMNLSSQWSKSRTIYCKHELPRGGEGTENMFHFLLLSSERRMRIIFQVSLCHANYTFYVSWKTDHCSLVPLYLDVRSNY